MKTIVVGAGLAGLTCAKVLRERGAEVSVFEASDDIGGRVRTDEKDGFLLDRGFQVYFTSYPWQGSTWTMRRSTSGASTPGRSSAGDRRRASSPTPCATRRRSSHPSSPMRLPSGTSSARSKRWPERMRWGSVPARETAVLIH